MLGTRSKSSHWRKLDNAAKVFPAIENNRDTRVFRIYCELTEAIDGGILQEALDITLEKYPLFLSVLRRGLFWFYLEKKEYKPVVKEEYKPPCSKLFSQETIKLLFRVNYYKKRINFEVFHVLTDGSGATNFIKELVKNYLCIRYKEKELKDIPLTKPNITIHDQETDSFSKYYNADTPSPDKRKSNAYQIRGVRKEYNALQIVEGVASVQEVLTKARAYHVSMTVYLTAVYLCAIHEEMNLRQEKKPVVLMVPVNLRNFFPSESMLNFFGWINPGFQFGGLDNSFEAVLEAVQKHFTQELTQERMARRMNEYTRFENHPILRFAPLEVKNLAIHAGVMFTEHDITAIFSNMSAITMPAEYEPYIEQFGVFTSTPKVELCMCSYKDKLALNFTSRFDSTNIERNFFHILEEHGIEVKVTKDQFPELDHKVIEETKVFQWVTFISVAMAVLSIMLNVFIVPWKLWSIFAIGASVSMWVTVITGYRKRRNLLKNAMWQLALISIGCIIWDLVTGWRGWSLDFVFPIFTVLILLFMIIMTRIQKLQVHEYMAYYLMAAMTGLIPLILILVGVVQWTLPSVLCAGLSFLFIMALFIFRKVDLMTELQKKLHF